MRYINPKMLEVSLQELKNTPYFVDKTGLIAEATKSIRTKNKYLCITRPRRFGKTTNVQTLGAFLAKGLDVAEMFEGLEVTKCTEAMQHFGAHDVIYIDFSYQGVDKITYLGYISIIKNGIIRDLDSMFPDLGLQEYSSLQEALADVYARFERRFCFVIDEWDSIFYDDRFSKQDRSEFLKFLKQLLKDKPYVEFAYMTGIMPIAKHSSGSELNMFTEFSAVDDPYFDKFFGFTESEVMALCKVHNEKHNNPRVDYEGLKYWYDGYFALDGTCRFNPRSVALALTLDFLNNYWTETGPGEEIYDCIKNNIADVRDDVVRMVAGEAVGAKMKKFAASDMRLRTRDEIFSAMVTFGFLTYYQGQVSVPNHELMLKFEEVLEMEEIGYPYKFVTKSQELLEATLDRDAETVAEILEIAHNQEVPLLEYKNEAALRAFLVMMYLASRQHYEVLQEQHGGKGFADVAFVPIDRKDSLHNPFVVELKVADDNETADDAALRGIVQIKSRDYLAMFKDALTEEYKFDAQPLAVAISWDPKNKKHAYRIEEME